MSDPSDHSPKILGDGSGLYVPGEQAPGEPRQGPLSIDFGGFVVGLYQSALMALGKLAYPDTGQVHQDLDAARHTIDVLVMLQSKTHGNLDEEEDRLLQGLVRELKLMYVETKK